MLRYLSKTKREGMGIINNPNFTVPSAHPYRSVAFFCLSLEPAAAATKCCPRKANSSAMLGGARSRWISFFSRFMYSGPASVDGFLSIEEFLFFA